MKTFFTLVILISFQLIHSQSYVKISTENKVLVPGKVVSMYSIGNLGATPSTKYLGFNLVDTFTSKAGVLVTSFSNPLEIKNSIYFSQAEGNLELVKIFGDGDYELVLFGMYQKSANDRYIFSANYNHRLQQLISFKIFSLPNEPNRILELKDVIVERDQFYLLASTEIEYLSSLHQKMVLINYDGTSISWAKSYNFVAPIHSESATHLTVDPNGNFAIGGTIKSTGDNFERMMLAEIKSNGDPGVLKKVELMAVNQTFSNRYGWTYIKNRGSNIHLFSQAILGGSEPGQLLVTMFDVNYALRTWRNYTLPIRVEFSMIDGNFFFFGGQAPLGNIYNGYTMARVNSSNAIVEAISYFEKGIQNLDLTTSSTACYDRANDKIWSAIKSNHMDGILIVENQSSLNHQCASNLSSSVAKDTIRITDFALTSKDLEIQVSDFAAQATEIKLLSEEICSPTYNDDVDKVYLNVIYRESTHELLIQDVENIKNISLTDLMGKFYISKDVDSVGDLELPIVLNPGIYNLSCTLKTGQRAVIRFPVSR
ncbi:MAG: hypothetical protein IPM92_07265 [Saprospiraceae bacterium]|nr:hypothetical protein [Saprospiraceae bacterium]